MRTKRITLAIVLIAILVAIDQITKYLVVQNMKPYKDEIKVLGDALVFYYIKNTGAAWGSFNKSTLLLAGISIVMIIALSIYYFKNIDKDNRKLVRICTIIIIAGAIGNLIDRLRLRYVVDFIYFKLINFPVFNVADIYVTVFAFVLVFLAIFIIKDDEEENNKTKKENSIKEKNETEKDVE